MSNITNQQLQPLYTMWAASTAEVNALAGINLMIFGVIAFVFVCRARQPGPEIPGAYRIALVSGLAGAVVAGLSPWLWAERPGPGGIVAGLAWLIYLLTRKD